MHVYSGDLLDPGIKPASQLDYLPLHHLELQKSTCLLTPQNDSFKKMAKKIALV